MKELHGGWFASFLSGSGGEEKEMEEMLLQAQFWLLCLTHRTFSMDMDVGRHLDLPEYSYLGASFNGQIYDVLSKRWLLGSFLFLDVVFYNNHSSSTTCSWYHFCLISGAYMWWRQIHNVMLKQGASKRISALGEGLTIKLRKEKDLWWYSCRTAMCLPKLEDNLP